jgi:site-specific DNA-methyltransferase (adenine-specific)
MADIKTILRELSVIVGFIISKYKPTLSEDQIDVKTFLELLNKHCDNFNKFDTDIKKIQDINDFAIHREIINNGIKLGKLISQKLDLNGEILWVGSKVKETYPFDMKIGSVGISLKEESYIIKNPSFADYLNALVQPLEPFRHIHVFRKFAQTEFNKWYKYTYNRLVEDSRNYDYNQIIFKYDKNDAFIKKSSKGLIFGDRYTQVEISLEENLDEESFNRKIGGSIIEHTFCKWISETLERKDKKYEELKKECSIKAGETLKTFINNNLNLDSVRILNLLQIYDRPYYYGKSLEIPKLYKVPCNTECQVRLISIEIKVPKSQLNVYFTFEILKRNNSNPFKFRVECRYSHGQFKGIPEAKLYYIDDLDQLRNLYEEISDNMETKKIRTGTETSSFGTNGRINHDSSKFYKSKLYSTLEEKQVVDKTENVLPDKFLNKFILGSAESMKELPNNSVHLMITSPPYNVTKEYDQDLSLKDYLALLKNSFQETYRVLVNGGRACINVANLGRRPYIPISDYISKIMYDIGFNMRGEIIWNKGASSSPSTAWGSWLSAANPILRDIHEYILIFSKGDYNRDSKAKQNTISKVQFMEWTKSIWTMNAESARRIGHPAPFPEDLPFRLIQLYSFKGDIVLDPFMGSGTTAVSAIKSQRKFVGYDNNKDYILLAENRLKPLLTQIKLDFERNGG